MTDKEVVRPPAVRFLPGIGACDRSIKSLKRFQDLIRHHQRWAHQMQFAQPLEQLIPGPIAPATQQLVVEREISKAIPVVVRIMRLINAPTGMTWTEKPIEYDFNAMKQVQRERTRKADFLMDYLQLAQEPEGKDRAWIFNATIQLLDQGIGAYEDLRLAAVRRKRLPLYWAGFVLSLPLRVMMHAGLITNEESTSEVTKWTLRVVQGAWAAALVWIGRLVQQEGWFDRLWNLVFPPGA